MFIALINAVIWILLSLWLFPGAVGYVVVFWLLILAFLKLMNVGFWEMAGDRELKAALENPVSRDEREITINIDGKRYSGTVKRKYTDDL